MTTQQLDIKNSIMFEVKLCRLHCVKTCRRRHRETVCIATYLAKTPLQLQKYYRKTCLRARARAYEEKWKTLCYTRRKCTNAWSYEPGQRKGHFFRLYLRIQSVPYFFLCYLFLLTTIRLVVIEETSTRLCESASSTYRRVSYISDGDHWSHCREY